MNKDVKRRLKQIGVSLVVCIIVLCMVLSMIR